MSQRRRARRTAAVVLSGLVLKHSADFGDSIRATLTVVTHASAAGAGYRCSSRRTPSVTATRAFSPSHG